MVSLRVTLANHRWHVILFLYSYGILYGNGYSVSNSKSSVITSSSWICRGTTWKANEANQQRPDLHRSAAPLWNTRGNDHGTVKDATMSQCDKLCYFWRWGGVLFVRRCNASDPLFLSVGKTTDHTDILTSKPSDWFSHTYWHTSYFRPNQETVVTRLKLAQVKR